MRTIITHNERFHADEVFAVATLFLAFPEEEFKVIRTRDEALFETGDIVLDVGRKSDGVKFFDHHQVGGAGERANGIGYASFGLVWKVYGEKVAGSKEGMERIDGKLVQVIDAGDNGVNISNSVIPDVFPYSVSSVIAVMNPTALEGDDYDAAFFRAVEVAKMIISREVAYAKAIADAEAMFASAYNAASDKRVIVVSEDKDWKAFSMTKNMQKYSETFYLIYPGYNGVWNVRALPDGTDSFGVRKPFPESWGGKVDAELQEVTGVVDAKFCHRARFYAVASSKEGAMALAKKALEV